MRQVAQRLQLHVDITNYEWPQRVLYTQHQQVKLCPSMLQPTSCNVLWQIILWLSNATRPPPHEPEIIGVDIDVIDEDMLADSPYNQRMQQLHGRCLSRVILSTAFVF